VRYRRGIGSPRLQWRPAVQPAYLVPQLDDRHDVQDPVDAPVPGAGEAVAGLADASHRAEWPVPGVTVRIAVGDPDGPNAAQRGVEEGIGDAMPAKIRTALMRGPPPSHRAVQLDLPRRRPGPGQSAHLRHPSRTGNRILPIRYRRRRYGRPLP